LIRVQEGKIEPQKNKKIISCSKDLDVFLRAECFSWFLEFFTENFFKFLTNQNPEPDPDAARDPMTMNPQ
jgi:hypothetical protein